MARRVVTIALLALLAAASSTLAQVEKPLETIADVPTRGRLALVKASEARKAGDDGRAVEVLQDIVDNHPNQDHYLVRFHLANSLAGAERLAEAADQYEAAVALEPRHAESWLSLGQVSFETGSYTRAAAALEEAFKGSDMPQTVWLYYAGVAYLQGDQPEQGVRVLRDLCRGRLGTPALDWFRALIAAESQVDDRRAGDRAVADMLTIYPDEPAAWFLKYQHALHYEDYRAAVVGLTVKDYLEPLALTERVRLGDILSAAEAPSWAAVHYRAALGDEPSSGDYERLVRAHLAAHENDEALAVLDNALLLAPSFTLWSMKGYAAYERENFATALDAFAECLILDPGYVRAYTLMGYCALELNRFDEAQISLNRAMESAEERRTATGLMRELKLRREALVE